MPIAFDTAQSAHALNEELPISLLHVAGMELGVSDWGKGTFIWGDGIKPPSPLWGPEGMGTYCAKDTAYTHLLYESHRTKLAANQDTAKLMKFLLLPGLEVLCQMELNGIWIDGERVATRRLEMIDRRDGFKRQTLEYVPEEFRDTADLNKDSFLRLWIFGEAPDGLGLIPTKVTEKTKVPAVDESVLETLQHPAMDLLRQYKKCVKALQFFDSWQEWTGPGGRIYPYFNPTGTVTGRRSCNRPNIQQVPRDVFLRGCFGAPPGWKFLEVDYSAMEVRLAAWIAGEANMLAVLADETRDIYKHTASLIYGIRESEVTKEQRQNAKAVVLGFIYGMGAKNFCTYAKETFNVEVSPEDGVRFRETFFNSYPDLVTWHDRQARTAHKYLQVVSPVGRIRHLVRILSNDRMEQAKAERQAINSPVQGMGGDMALACMVSLFDKFPEDECKIVGDVHDALLFQIREDVWPKWTYDILKTMEAPPALEPFHLDIPVRMKADASIGQYWKEGTEVKLSDFTSPGVLRTTWPIAEYE